MCYFLEIFYKPSIEPDEPKKTSNTLCGDGWWKPFDNFKFFPIDLNTLTRDPMSQHNTLFQHEVALLPI